MLINQYCATFLPSNIVISGVNVAHASLVAAYENGEFPLSAKAPHFRQAIAAGAPQSSSEADQYQPGRELYFTEKRYKDMSTKPWLENETIAAVGWLAKGADSLKDYATALVVQQLLDVSLEDGIRVPTDIDRGIRSFYSPYQTAGLFGVTVRAEPKNGVETLKRALDIVAGSAQEKNIAKAV